MKRRTTRADTREGGKGGRRLVRMALPAARDLEDVVLRTEPPNPLFATG